MSRPNKVLLSDAQVEQLGTAFVRLNQQYGLTNLGFTFADFLTNPNEIAIHQYFANKHLLQNRRFGMAILLPMFLTNPDEILLAALNVECGYREAEGLRCEQLLTKQIIAAQWIAIANLIWRQEKNDAQFERKHRVLLRGTALVEPFAHYHRCERKQAGGKR